MPDYSNYREGNPVAINDVITFITRIDRSTGKSLYSLYGQPSTYDDQMIVPITFDHKARKTFEYLFYEHIESGDTEEIVFSDEGHHAYYNYEKGVVIIDGNTVENIWNLHELFNLIEDHFGYKLPHYYPIGDMNVYDKPSRTFPVAPFEPLQE